MNVKHMYYNLCKVIQNRLWTHVQCTQIHAYNIISEQVQYWAKPSKALLPGSKSRLIWEISLMFWRKHKLFWKSSIPLWKVLDPNPRCLRAVFDSSVVRQRFTFDVLKGISLLPSHAPAKFLSGSAWYKSSVSCRYIHERSWEPWRRADGA